MAAPIAPTDTNKQTSSETSYQVGIVTQTDYETVSGS